MYRPDTEHPAWHLAVIAAIPAAFIAGFALLDLIESIVRGTNG